MTAEPERCLRTCMREARVAAARVELEACLCALREGG
jgi:hypothetical protein